MIKHNIPLTKDNILKVVNLSNFMGKLKIVLKKETHLYKTI